MRLDKAPLANRLHETLQLHVAGNEEFMLFILFLQSFEKLDSLGCSVSRRIGPMWRPVSHLHNDGLQGLKVIPECDLDFTLCTLAEIEFTGGHYVLQNPSASNHHHQ